MMTFGPVSHSPILLLLIRVVVLINCAALSLALSEDDVAHTVSSWCPNAFFNFGDSLSDTGNVVQAMPGYSVAEHLPYGEVFFGKPTGRHSNGRLVIDFILMSFKLPLLDPYLLPFANGVHGLNFAFAGATATNGGRLPYNFNYQIDHFIRLKNRVLQTKPQLFLAQNLNRVDQAIFDTALYTICIGGNDLNYVITGEIQPEAIIENLVPNIVQAMERAVQRLYFQGARKFLIFNGPPKGCSSTVLTKLNGLGLPTDNLGCLTAINELDQALNSEHFKSVQRLRASLPNVTIIFFDYYAANIEITTNPSKYGLNPDLTHTACCGAPGFGAWNVNPKSHCGKPGSYRSDHPDQYIYWDGTHFTEAFYRQIAKFVLNGEFSDPPINLTKVCNLSFENFENKTYEEVYPTISSLLFDK